MEEKDELLEEYRDGIVESIFGLLLSLIFVIIFSISTIRLSGSINPVYSIFTNGIIIGINIVLIIHNGIEIISYSMLYKNRRNFLEVNNDRNDVKFEENNVTDPKND